MADVQVSGAGFDMASASLISDFFGGGEPAVVVPARAGFAVAVTLLVFCSAAGGVHFILEDDGGGPLLPAMTSGVGGTFALAGGPSGPLCVTPVGSGLNYRSNGAPTFIVRYFYSTAAGL